MSARTRKVFKERIGPRIARKKSVRRAVMIVSLPLLAGDTKRKAMARVKAHIQFHEPCPCRVVPLPGGITIKGYNI